MEVKNEHHKVISTETRSLGKRKEGMDVVPSVSIPMWLSVVCSSFLFWGTIIVNARPEPVVPISQFSQQMDAQSTGGPPVRVVHRQDLNKKILAALIVASSLLAGILICLLCFCIFRQKISKKPSKKSAADSDVAGGLSLSPVVSKLNSLTASGRKGSVAAFDYQLLEAATNRFGESNLLFEGGRGRIYKAQFNEKSFAAVKRLNDVGQDAEREFENEMNWLSKIHHQNIIHLQGYCIRGERRYIVYEIMQNRSLDAQLHGPTHGSALTWHLRLKIAVDVAKGLEFLHERCNPPLVHRNLKSSNILLDSDFNAKISDFGLAVTAGVPNKNLKLSGSLGYLAPEYLLDGKLTDKSDVYAFGVVLLELLLGRKPVEKTTTSQCQTLVTWAMPLLTDRTKLPNIIAPVIKGTMDLKHLYQVAAVAVLCVQPEPSYRPLITDVLHSLFPLVPVELGGSLRVEVAPPLCKDDALHMTG